MIITAGVKDAAELRRLSIKTFYDAFAAFNKQKDMEQYLAEEQSIEKITAELQEPGSTFFLACIDDVLAGYAKINISDTSPALPGIMQLEIARLYVLKDFQNRNIGLALLDHCIAEATAHHCNLIWLGVWEHNVNAIRFYKRHGFELFGTHPFILGSDVQTDQLMKKELIPSK
jgi:ribosomal protein S18 acetylase RimI-like enzyme